MRLLVYFSVCLFWGSSYILMKKAYLVFGPITIGALRVASGGAVLWIIWGFNKQVRGVPRTKWLKLGWIAVLGFVYPFIVQPSIISQTNSSYMALVNSFVPIMLVLISVLFFKKSFNVFEVLGVVFGFGFMILFTWNEIIGNGNLFVFINSLGVPACYALFTIYVKKWFKDVAPLALAVCGLSVAFLMLLPTALVREEVKPEGGILMGLLAVTLLGVISTGLAHLLFYNLIIKSGPLVASSVNFVIPTVAIFWGFLDGERLALKQIVAIPGIYLMVALIQFKGTTKKIS